MNCTVITVTVTLIVEKKRFADLKNLILSDIIRHALMWYKSRVTNLTGVLLNEAHRNLKGPTGILGVTLAVSGMCRKGEMLQLMHTHPCNVYRSMTVYPPQKPEVFPLTMTTEGCAGSCLASAVVVSVTALGSSSSLSSSMPSEKPSTSLTVSSIVACLAFTVSILHLEWSEAICSW